MDIIRVGLVMFVAGETGENCPVGWCRMTGGTFGPFSIMGTRENREELSIVVGKITGFSGRMAGIAVGTGKIITGHSTMDIVRIGLIMGMTINAAEFCPVGRVDMTGAAVIPFIDMST